MDKKYGHTLEERFEVLENIIAIAKTEIINGNSVIVSTVSHKRKMREIARGKLKRFMEINLICETSKCKERDYKLIYEKFKNTKNDCLPGITEPYEITDDAELILDTGKYTLDKTKEIINKRTLKFLEDQLMT